MNERKKIPGVADYIIAHRRRRKDTFLDEIDRLIDWKPIEKLLAKKIRRNVNAVGNPAYPALAMFKTPAQFPDPVVFPCSHGIVSTPRQTFSLNASDFVRPHRFRTISDAPLPS